MERRAPVTTGKAEVAWSADGRTVTKTYDEWSTPVLGSTLDSFENEVAANQLLLRNPPPIPTPQLVGVDRSRSTLSFEAVDGEPLGPKFPLALEPADLTAVLDVVRALADYRPDGGELRAFPLDGRLARHVATGLIDDQAAQRIDSAAMSRPWQFAHGDVTARNVLRGGTGEVWLIDWEWAGSHPVLYDLAFFWFSLIDVAGARERVESLVAPADREAFVAAAALVQLLHLQMWTDRGASMTDEQLDRHVRSLDATLTELLV